jgi:Tfp pilus assembly protein PilV
MSHGLRFRDRRGGFTLLEVLIAAMLLVVGMVGSIALILGLLQANKTARARDTGYFLAQQALDQLEMIPLVGRTGATWTTNQPAWLSVAFPYATINFPNEPTCYAMANDVVSDRPIQCSAAQEAAFILRTWTCCATPGLGATTTLPIGAPCLLPSGQGPISSPDAIPTGGVTANPNGAVCYIQAEVTWPVEDPVGHNLLLANAPAAALFQDSPANLSFGNHVWASMVRSE